MTMSPLLATVFGYEPTLALSIAAIVCYSIVALITAYLCYHHRKPYYTWLIIIPMTAVAEAVGYVFRILFADQQTLGTYIAFDLLVLLSPNALALVNYKIAGKLLCVSNNRAFGLKPGYIAKLFVASDIFAFLSQAGGGGLSANGSKQSIAQAITLIGLAVQLVFLAVFMYLVYHIQTKPQYGFNPHSVESAILAQNVQPVFWCLYITTGLLYIRSVYRMVEYSDGYTGPVAHSEAAFYVLDTLVILCMFVTYICLWFTRYLPATVTVNKPQVQVADMYYESKV